MANDKLRLIIVGAWLDIQCERIYKFQHVYYIPYIHLILIFMHFDLDIYFSYIHVDYRNISLLSS